MYRLLMDDDVQRQVDEQVRLFERVWVRNLEQRLSPAVTASAPRRPPRRAASVVGKLRSLFL